MANTQTTPPTVEDLRKQFGRRIAFLRKEKGFTQEELARKMKVDTVFIAYIEGGQRSPSFVNLHSLSVALEIHPMELFRF